MIRTELKQHQKEIVSTLSRRKRCLLCDKAGRGKTLSVLGAFDYLKTKGRVDRLLAMAPKNAYEKRVWESEVKRHSNLRVIDLETIKGIVGSANPDRVEKLLEKFDVIFCKHSHLRNSLDYIRLITRGRTIICIDEAHAFKNPTAKLTVLCRIILKQAFAVWALTATPLSKDLEDSYHICNLVKPGSLGAFDWFRDTICSTQEMRIKIGGAQRKITKIVGILNRAVFDQMINSFVIKGQSEIVPEFHKLNYVLNPAEQSIYRRIAHGIGAQPKSEDKEWIKSLFEQEQTQPEVIKAIDLHSSRFIYLQYAADGIVNRKGEIGGFGTKYNLILDKVKEVTKKGQSCIVYFDYYQSIDNFKKQLVKECTNVKVLESSGRSSVTEQDINEKACKLKPHVLLCTKAGSASTSYYYINHVIFGNIPTVPETFVQTVGRICRLNTIYRDDLHVWIPISENIDEYKLRIVCSKAEMMGAIAGEEATIPDWFKEQVWDDKSIRTYKKYFLWK